MRPRLGYRRGSTILHRLHPLLKLAWLVLITAVVFLVPNPYFNLGLVLVLLLLFPSIGVRFRDLQGFRALLAAAALIILLQILFWKAGPVAAVVGPVQITYPGITRGIYLGARFMTVVLVSYLFVLTTSPNLLAYSLMRAGLPYRYGFTFVTALRMIPIFEEEVRTVLRAQQVRGVSFRPRKWNEFWKNLKAFTLPMLVSAMGKVDALSISMEGRCFGMYPTRTYYHARNDYAGDLWAGLALFLGVIAVISYRFWEGIF
jgi:energy-coupling factor transport system permease protein